jgi:DNA-binding GntR family transcriptional regulator
MTMEQLRQLWELREVLELNSLRLAMRDGGGALTRRLSPIIERMKKATNESDPSLFRRCDAAFHSAIIAGSNNQFIQTGYNIIALRVQVLRNRVSQEAHNWRALDDHAAVLDHVRTGDAEAAVESLYKHIRGTLDAYIAARETKVNSVA